MILANIISVLNITKKAKPMNTQTRQSSPTTKTNTKHSTKNEQWKTLKTLSMSKQWIFEEIDADCWVTFGRKPGPPSTVTLCQSNLLNHLQPSTPSPSPFHSLPKTSAIRLRNALVSEDFLTKKTKKHRNKEYRKGGTPKCCILIPSLHPLYNYSVN